MSNRISNLFKIKYPIIQGGMIWCSGWELASAVSNNGGLGLLGSGSMYPADLKENIKKVKQATNNPFGVNIPLIYPNVEEIIKIIIEEKVPIVFTSAGNPKTWTEILQKEGVKVVHVIANTKFAIKADEAGVDAIVAEGFEAGGHNGREETTSLTLIPLVRSVTALPLIAAGGIATGRAILSAMVLGADAVQMGTRFVASIESSAHQNFKNQIVKVPEGGTRLALKQLIPVRLIKNKFSNDIEKAELEGKSSLYLSELLGNRRAKLGMFEGDIDEGELEIGQVSALINSIKPVKNIFDDILLEFRVAREQISHDRFKF
ncbi:MAG: nitronate monooxygenase [Bacteroidales bacterium]|nr:nitronate monooxygenase [Bacteroidales bacterium]MBN2756044.1 nitronate monooxygenase [Bacteroidales bacterium]